MRNVKDERKDRNPFQFAEPSFVLLFDPSAIEMGEVQNFFMEQKR